MDGTTDGSLKPRHHALFILLAVLGGSGLMVYVAMWIIVPKEP